MQISFLWKKRNARDDGKGEMVGLPRKKKRKWIKMVDLSKNPENSWTKLLAKNGKSS